MKKNLIIAATPFVLLCVFYFLVGKTSLLPAPIRVPGPHPGPSQDRQESWEEDLEYLKTQFPRLHIRPFHTMNATDFYQEVELLEQSLPELSDNQILWELSRILAMTGESHTRILPNRDWEGAFLPLRFWIFPQGVYVIDALPGYQQWIGKELKAINGVPIKDIETLLSQYIPHETDMGLQNRTPLFLSQMTRQNLLDLGFNPQGQENWIEWSDGEIVTLPILTEVEYSNYMTNFSSTWRPEEAPLFMRNRADNYWYQVLESPGLIYIQYNRCSKKETLSMESFVNTLLEEMNAPEIQCLILDMRYNGGGDSSLLQDFIKTMETHPLNQQGSFYVIIGRETNSSAVLNSMELRERTQAIFVGEPTGGSMVHYGQYNSVVLPHSRLVLQYSTKFFSTGILDPPTMDRQDRRGGRGYPPQRGQEYSQFPGQSFITDVIIDHHSQDYFSGRDPWLEYILEELRSNQEGM